MPNGSKVKPGSDYDVLADSPILAGVDLTTTEFTAGGIAHYWTYLGQAEWDGARVVQMLTPLIQEHIRFWGGLPYASGYNLFGLYGTSPLAFPPVVVVPGQPGDGGEGNRPAPAHDPFLSEGTSGCVHEVGTAGLLWDLGDSASAPRSFRFPWRRSRRVRSAMRPSPCPTDSA